MYLKGGQILDKMNEIDNIEELKELISEPETIWGDHVILSMLSKALKFNII